MSCVDAALLDCPAAFLRVWEPRIGGVISSAALWTAVRAYRGHPINMRQEWWLGGRAPHALPVPPSVLDGRAAAVSGARGGAWPPYQ